MYIYLFVFFSNVRAGKTQNSHLPKLVPLFLTQTLTPPQTLVWLAVPWWFWLACGF